MKVLFKISVFLLISGLLVNCSSPSDSDEEELQPRTFQATTTGSIENNFSGTATYSLRSPENQGEDFLFLNLEVGDNPLTSDDSPFEKTGLFPVALWNSSASTVEIDNSPFMMFYINPVNYKVSNLTAGTITIQEKTSNSIIGTFDLTGNKSTGENFSVKGTFKADLSE